MVGGDSAATLRTSRWLAGFEGGGANLGCYIKLDGELTWSTKETLELLLELHFTGFVKEKSIGHVPKERTVGVYESENWSWVAKIVIS